MLVGKIISDVYFISFVFEVKSPDKFNNKINDLPESKQDDEEIELEKEKSKALNILAKIVPAAEVFFRPNNDGKKVSIKSKFTLFA